MMYWMKPMYIRTCKRTASLLNDDSGCLKAVPLVLEVPDHSVFRVE